MLKLPILILLAISHTCFAVADVTDDNSVDANDLVIFLGYWLGEPNADPNCDFNEDGDIDFVDYAILAGEWTGRLRHVVSEILKAYDINNTIATYTLTAIELQGQYAEQYIISELPKNGTLYDLYGVLPANYGTKFATVRNVPYSIKHGGSCVYYYATDPNNDSFGFKAAKITDNRQSSQATATITVNTLTPDCLYFDRLASVHIPDANSIEFDDSVSFVCYFRPMGRYGTIVEKRASTGAGYKLSMRAKHVFLEVWNAAGGYGRAVCDQYNSDTLWMDSWHTVAITLGGSENQFSIDSGLITGDISHLPAGPYSNDANLVIGESFYGQIDKLTWFDAKSGFELDLYLIEPRTEYDWPLSPTDYLAQFRMDEGTGDTITENVTGTLTGTLNNVDWVPDDRPKRRNVNR